MREHTPTTREVAYRYTDFPYAALGEEPADPAEFTRWLAQHDAEVAAKALRDAAESARHNGVPGAELPMPRTLVAGWLRARAKDIEREAGIR